MLTKGSLNSFEYIKENAETVNRVILTTHVPQPRETLVRGIDVTDYSETERDELKELWAEYQAYLKRQHEATFKFEDFISHTTNEEVKLKWRSFHPESITE